MYGLGHSEEVVRRALEPYRPGEDVYVFTKCGRRWEGRPEGVIENDLRPESIREECEASLRRLGVERIDLYQAHWPDWTTGTLLEDSWGTMAELADEGKVRWIGVSNFDEQLLARCESIRHVDSVQPTLSLLQRGSAKAIIPWAAEHGAGVICYSPMASGLLTGAFDRARLAGLGDDDWRRLSAAFQEPEVSRSLALVDRLRAIADELSTTSRRRWRSRGCSRNPVSPGAIVGARTARHVDGWAPASDLALDEGVLREIARAIEETGAGSDEPPAPPAHIRPPAAAEASP